MKQNLMTRLISSYGPLALAALILSVAPGLGEDVIARVVLQPDTTVVLFQDWESGIGDWWVDNGVWEVGSPTVGPAACFSGLSCAATILDGNYPSDADTRLISPAITLPNLTGADRLLLKFRHWFLLTESAHGPDQGYVQISVAGGEWQTIAGPYSGGNPAWTQVCLDLSAYAGEAIRLGFRLMSDWIYEDNGWYIDDITIVEKRFKFDGREDFEDGVGDWSVDNGLWETGTPGIGPDSCHSGDSCAGTVLNGPYPSNADTRLISPPVRLNPGEGQLPGLFFWHWFLLTESAHGNDIGLVQISVDGGPWQDVAGPYSGISPIWSQVYVDLSAFADSLVRIAFFMVSDWIYEDAGWYIDDIRLTGITCCEIAGDASDDGDINLADAVFLINYIFKGGPAPFCIDEGDANSDCAINIGDAVHIINYVFKSGQAPSCGCVSK